MHYKNVPVVVSCHDHCGVPLGVPKCVSAQKCGDAPDTMQAERSEWSQTGDLLGFNIGPVDPENLEGYQSI